MASVDDVPSPVPGVTSVSASSVTAKEWEGCTVSIIVKTAQGEHKRTLYTHDVFERPEQFEKLVLRRDKHDAILLLGKVNDEDKGKVATPLFPTDRLELILTIVQRKFPGIVRLEVTKGITGGKRKVSDSA